MNRNIWVAGAGIALLAPVLMALPGHSAPAHDKNPQESGTQAVVAGAPGQKVRTIQRLPGKRVESLTIVNDEGPSWLGIETHEVTPDKVKELKLPAERGVVVGRIAPDSPAAKAGLRGTKQDKNGKLEQLGDLIVAIDEKPIKNLRDLVAALSKHQVGDTVTITVIRDGERKTLDVRLSSG